MVTGDRIKLTLTDMAYLGHAMGKVDGQVVFAAFGIPGEEALVEVWRRKNDYPSGRVVEVIKPSPHRVSPPCPYFGRCGGCQLQHIKYEFQLELKRRVVEEQLRRIGKMTSPPVSPALPSPEEWQYRNHARFTVDSQGRLAFVRWDNFRFITIEKCLIMHPWINSTLSHLQGKCRGAKQISLRYGVRTGQWLIQPSLESYGVPLKTGQPHYEEETSGKRFRISSASFFQVNTLQGERLVETLKQRLDPQGEGLLIDAYAGVGTFAVLLAPDYARVLAIEESASAIRDAATNTAGLSNVEFVEGKTEDVLPQLSVQPDAVILDPPRAGCHKSVLDSLLKLKPPRIVYVSCDPATLARDLHYLCQGGYRLVEVLPIDMFPQTYHIECLATLVLQ